MEYKNVAKYIVLNNFLFTFANVNRVGWTMFVHLSPTKQLSIDLALGFSYAILLSYNMFT